MTPYHQGKFARESGLGRETNPFASNNPRAALWERGWLDADAAFSTLEKEDKSQ